MTFPSPILKITFDPAGTPLVILNWGERGSMDGLPWAQVLQVEPYVNGATMGFHALGNVSRKIRVTARKEFATAAAMVTALLTHDAALPVAVEKELHFRVLDVTEPDTETEANRTAAHYKTTRAAIESADPRLDFESLAMEITYSIQIGALVVGP